MDLWLHSIFCSSLGELQLLSHMDERERSQEDSIREILIMSLTYRVWIGLNEHTLKTDSTSVDTARPLGVLLRLL